MTEDEKIVIVQDASMAMLKASQAYCESIAGTCDRSAIKVITALGGVLAACMLQAAKTTAKEGTTPLQITKMCLDILEQQSKRYYAAYLDAKGEKPACTADDYPKDMPLTAREMCAALGVNPAHVIHIEMDFGDDD